jgi:hypothetical protein
MNNNVLSNKDECIDFLLEKCIDDPGCKRLYMSCIKYILNSYYTSHYNSGYTINPANLISDSNSSSNIVRYTTHNSVGE